MKSIFWLSFKATLLAAVLAFINSCSPPQAFNPNGSLATPKAISPSLVNRGVSEFEKYKKKYPRSKSAAKNAQLQRVANRLVKVIDMPQAQWEFVVFENNSPNAFALPGGKVGVNSGLFQVTQSDAGLATVVAHEIAHVTLNHASGRQNRVIGAAIGGLVLDQVLRSKDTSKEKRVGAAAVYGAATTLGMVLPHSREQELQADQIGTVYMAKAGYDPNEAVHLWRRFSAYKNKTNKRKTPEFLSTHPLDERRIQKLQEFMPAAEKFYRK